MDTRYSDSVQQQTDDYGLLQQASTQLEEILEGKADSVGAHWDLKKDNGRPVYVLTLKDSTGEVSGRIGPKELRSPHMLRFRLYRLWGDLLHAESQRRIDRLLSAEE